MWPAAPLIKRWKRRARRKYYESMPLLAEGQQLAWSQVPRNLLHTAAPPVHGWRNSPGSQQHGIITCNDIEPWVYLGLAMRRENAGFKQEQDAFVHKTLVVKKCRLPWSHSHSCFSENPSFFQKRKGTRLTKTWMGSKMGLHGQHDLSHLWSPFSVSSMNHYY